MRVIAAHTWPEWAQPAGSIVGSTRSRSMSSQTMPADLPPSSSVTRAIRSPQSDITRRPAAVEPVKETLSTSRWRTRCSPTSRLAGRTLITPSGRPAASSASASSSVLDRAFGRGLP